MKRLFSGKRKGKVHISATGRTFLSSAEFPLLFSVEREDLECIILIDIESSEYYRTIEYQAVDDERGEGHIVILYDLDDRKNIYYSPGLSVDEEDYRHFNDIRQIRETVINGFHEYGGNGLKAAMDMTDSAGRRVAYTIEENNPSAELGGLVAPVARDVAEPEFFPFIYMDYFGFSPAESTEVAAEVDGRESPVVSLPVKLNGIKPYMIRYSLRSPVLNWNGEKSGPLEYAAPAAGESDLEYGGWIYHLAWRGNIPETAGLTSCGEGGDISVLFSPPVPNLLYLDPSEEIKGRFSFSSERHRGIFAGEYTLAYRGRWRFTLHPTHCSKPAVLPGKWWRNYRFIMDVSLDTRRVESEWSVK